MVVERNPNRMNYLGNTRLIQFHGTIVEHSNFVIFQFYDVVILAIFSRDVIVAVNWEVFLMSKD